MDHIKLKVAEALQEDVNNGVARIDSGYMHEIGVRRGDFVMIKGDKETVAMVDRAYPGDIGLNIVRIDGITRRNAKTSIGEFVEVYRADVEEAQKVYLAPSGNEPFNQPPLILKKGMIGKAVIKGDVVALGSGRRRRISMSDSPFDDIFSFMTDEIYSFGLGGIKFVVTKTVPEGAVVITDETEIIYNPNAVVEEEKKIGVSYEDVGGLTDEIKKVREMVELPLKHPELFKRLGIDAPKGILLYGPPGTGKTLLAKAVANETNSNFLLINGPEIMSKYYGQSEANLRKKFEEAEKNAPSIIFIDEIDAIAPKREDIKGEVERRVVAQLLTLMDGLKARGQVVVIAATNMVNEIDPALRRPGRFDREIEVGVPNKEARKEILQIHTRNMPLIGDFDKKNVISVLKEYKQKSVEDEHNDSKKDSTESKDSVKISSKTALVNEAIDKIKSLKTKEEVIDYLKSSNASLYGIVNTKLREQMLDRIAEITHGYVGADLAALSREAAMIRLRAVVPDIENLKDQNEISKEILEKLQITIDDFYEALKFVKPSAMREVLIEVPDVKWSDVGGLEEVKQELIEVVDWPIKVPDAFSTMGIKPPKGILLYGPPGTGKTLLAKAVANETKVNFISVKGPEILSKYVGESERAVRKIFEKARQTSPSIVFIDELDAIAPKRGLYDNRVSETVVNQLLTEMDGMQELRNVVVLAATNRPDIIDSALLRPGRFDRLIYVPSPDEESRLKILKTQTKNMPLDKDVDLEELAKLTENYVGADLAALCREAAIISLREDIYAKKISMKHFEKALEVVKPSVTEEIKKYYDEMKEKLKATHKTMEVVPNYYG